MNWNLEEAIAYYKTQGAPQDQNALVGLLKEVQQENGGAIPQSALPVIARAYNVKDNYLLAIIKRIPRLRLSDRHLLEVCAGPNCGKCAGLAAFAESLQSSTVTVKFVSCMRQCGKGPNVKWDGQLHNRADEVLLRQLTNSAQNGTER